MPDPKYWQNHLPSLETLLKHKPFGLLTDIDGTISPIAPTPEEALVTPAARESLRALQTRLALVAALTGRGAADGQRMLNLPQMLVVGNHGLERGQDGETIILPAARAYLQAMQAALDEIAPLLAEYGLTAEPKGVTASLHYRNAPQRDSLRDKIHAQIAALADKHGLKLFEGRYTFELHPPIDIHKGTALMHLAEEFKLAGLVFVGDDVTDVNAFRALKTLREVGQLAGYALGVVSDEGPPAVRAEADFTLDGVPDVERFLQWLWDNAG